MPVTRPLARARRSWRRARRRHGWLDHVARAVTRYQQADGRRLAAAVTYYGFFAAFALGLLGFAALGYVLDESSVQRFIDQSLPGLDTSALRQARATVSLFALVSLPVIGLLWVDSLRSSVRAIWRIEEYPGGFLGRWLIDLLALAALGLLLAVSLTVAIGAEALLDWVLRGIVGPEVAPARWTLAAARFLLTLLVNTLLAIAVLTMLPRLRMPLSRVLAPALLIVAGLELLATIGRLAIARAEHNPAFQVVAGAAGLLVFLLLLNQVILFAAALTATGTSGQVRDLATGELLSGQPPAGEVSGQPPAGESGRGA